MLKFGFVVNEDKSQWEPVQVITWLGVVLDTNQGCISVAEQRISKLKTSIDSVLKGEHNVKARDLASVVGQILSLSPCVGCVARIMSRSMYAAVNEKVSWNSNVVLTQKACVELKFWKQNVDSLNCRSPWPVPLRRPEKFVYSDASEQACGSFIQNESKIFHRN